jgi:uncharacterized protein YqgV (UPF0045/DUF77 family)
MLSREWEPLHREPEKVGAVASCRAEFLVEPFTEGTLGPHVEAAIGALRPFDVDAEIGAFGTTLQGRCPEVLAAVEAVVTAATAAGATKVTVTVTAVPSS